MNELLTPQELAKLAKKVKDNTATNEETIQYLDIAKGLSDEFLTALRSLPTDEELAKSK